MSGWVPGRYNSATRKIGNLCTLTVFWDSMRGLHEKTGYRWKSSTGHESKRDLFFKNEDDAKASAERWLRAALAAAAAELGT